MGKKPAASSATQSAEGELQPHMDVGHADAPRQMFVSAALSMSWQLAVVVLAPVLAGHWLDGRFKSAPWLTLTGFALALILSAIVLKRVVKEFSVSSSDRSKT